MTSQEMADNIWKMLIDLRLQLNEEREDAANAANAEDISDDEGQLTKSDMEAKVVSLYYMMLDDICDLYDDIHEDFELDCVNEERMKLLKRITSIYTQLFGSFR